MAKSWHRSRWPLTACQSAVQNGARYQDLPHELLCEAVFRTILCALASAAYGGVFMIFLFKLVESRTAPRSLAHAYVVQNFFLPLASVTVLYAVEYISL